MECSLSNRARVRRKSTSIQEEKTRWHAAGRRPRATGRPPAAGGPAPGAAATIATMDLALATPAPAASRLRPFGEHLRAWRLRRRHEPDGPKAPRRNGASGGSTGARHLSFRAISNRGDRPRPQPEMVLRLAERLDVPLRERNALLVAAGYAPMYRERPLDDPALAAARQAVQLILKEPRALSPRSRWTGTGTCWRTTRWCRTCWPARPLAAAGR